MVKFIATKIFLFMLLPLLCSPVWALEDMFANRSMLFGTFAESSSGNDPYFATSEPGEPVETGGNSLWAGWVAPSTGRITLTVTGLISASRWVGIAVGASVSTLYVVNKSGYPFASKVSVPVTAGQEYAIWVATGYPGDSALTLTLSFATDPLLAHVQGPATTLDNDHFEDRIELLGTSVAAIAYNGSATSELELGLPRTVWWSWTAPAAGHVRVSLAGSDPYMSANLYVGQTLGTLTYQGGVYTDQSYDFPVTAGTNYKIAASNSNPDPWGSVVIALTFLPTPALDHFILPPCRIIDTRLAPGPLGGPALPGFTHRIFDVTLSNCNIPPRIPSIIVNVTVTQSQWSGYLTLYAGDQPIPQTSTITFQPGQTRANFAIVELARNGSGTLGIFNGSPFSTHVIVDAFGYFSNLSGPE